MAGGGRVWFTSDLHIGHKLVSGLRGYESTETHDAALVGWWNAVVKEGDLVWILGDLTLREPGSEYVRAVVGKLAGRKRLVLGNHDAAHPAHRRFVKAEQATRGLRGVEWTGTAAQARIGEGGEAVLLSHFPYDGDNEERAGKEDRWRTWRLRDEGAVLLHGHTHGGERERVSRSKLWTLQVHVGLDAWGMLPVSADAIAALVKEQA